MKPPRSNSSKSGPKPEIIKVDGEVDWKDALKHALHKSKPKEGWLDGKGEQPKKKGQQK